MKNKKMAIVFDFIVLALCALMIGFLWVTAITGDVLGSGWEIMQKFKQFAVPIIYLVALVCLTIVATILSLFASFNVIKNAKFIRVLNVVTFAISCFMLFLFVVVITQVLVMPYVRTYLGWGSIVNIILGVISGTMAIVNTTVFKKKIM